jgi:hypothetical protein
MYGMLGECGVKEGKLAGEAEVSGKREEVTEEQHVVVRLLERAAHDQAVEEFLTCTFLSIPRYLKTCRRVCRVWDAFIRAKVWGRASARRHLRAGLARNWRLGVPIRQFEFAAPADCLACDDSLLVVGGSGSVSVYSLLPVRHLANLDLGQDCGQAEEVRLAVATDFFVTVQTVTRKMQVWSTSCRLLERGRALLDSVDLWDLSLRRVAARGDSVVLAGSAGGGWMFGARGVLLVYSMGPAGLEQRCTVTLEQELGIARTLDWHHGSGVFLTGHDREVVVWALGTGEEVQRLDTGLVVHLVVRGGLLITAGSLQVPPHASLCACQCSHGLVTMSSSPQLAAIPQSLGVRFWSLETGSLLAVHGAGAYYEQIVLAGDQLFARGLQCDRWAGGQSSGAQAGAANRPPGTRIGLPAGRQPAA